MRREVGFADRDRSRRLFCRGTACSVGYTGGIRTESRRHPGFKRCPAPQRLLRRPPAPAPKAAPAPVAKPVAPPAPSPAPAAVPAPKPSPHRQAFCGCSDSPGMSRSGAFGWMRAMRTPDLRTRWLLSFYFLRLAVTNAVRWRRGKNHQGKVREGCSGGLQTQDSPSIPVRTGERRLLRWLQESRASSGSTMMSSSPTLRPLIGKPRAVCPTSEAEPEEIQKRYAERQAAWDGAERYSARKRDRCPYSMPNVLVNGVRMKGAKAWII